MREYKEDTFTKKVPCNWYCDKCGKLIPDYGGYTLNDKIRVSFEYNEWGDWWRNDEDSWEIKDLCLECTRELKKLLIENGYKVTEVEDNY